MDNVVVGAAIIDGGRLLAAQRAFPPELAGCWELPGGKVETGETGPEALARECREELGVQVLIGERIGGNWPLEGGWVLRVWTAEIAVGAPQALEHSTLRWLAENELFDVSWLAADRPVVAALRPYLKKSCGQTGFARDAAGQRSASGTLPPRRRRRPLRPGPRPAGRGWSMRWWPR